jgi:hypothetical protein
MLHSTRLVYEKHHDGGSLRGPEIITDTTMPPFGVAETLVPAGVPAHETFAFWLSTHRDDTWPTGQRFWRTAVLRECLPSDATELAFEAIAPLVG